MSDAQTAYTAACQYVNAGLSVLPIRADGSKAPALSSWKMLQSRLPLPQELQEWFRPGSPIGLGIIGGQVSHGLEILDFDDAALFADLCTLAAASGMGPLIDRIRAGCHEATPRGIHLPYYCSVVVGNTKLASRPTTKAEQKEEPGKAVKALIETRGEGGYVVVAPSSGAVHPSGAPYTLLSGSWLTVATITPEERADLWNLCRTFDLMPIRAEKDPSPSSPSPSGTRPGDLFAAATPWVDILEPAGWTWVYRQGAIDYWRRPGKTVGISASTNYHDSGYFLLLVVIDMLRAGTGIW